MFSFFGAEQGMRGLIDWRGRASAREFATTLIFSFVAACAAGILFPPEHHPRVALGLSAVLIVPVVGVITRRYHDFGSRGLIVALSFGFTLLMLAAAFTVRDDDLREAAQYIPLGLITLQSLGLLELWKRRPDAEANAFGEVPADTAALLLEPEPQLGDWDDEEGGEDSWEEEFGLDYPPDSRGRNPDA
jgi:uncharacterized membrane protein YhaH (DUF805 family)